MEDSPLEAPVEAPVEADVPQQKEPVTARGVIWTFDPELEIAVDSSKLADRPLPTIEGVDFAPSDGRGPSPLLWI